MVDDCSGVRAAAERSIEETCAVNINRFRSDRSRRINRSTLSELFISFLAKFADISLRALEQGICLYTGQWEDVKNNMTWRPKTYVEDPFEQPSNAAWTVSSRQLTKISEAFQTTHRTLTSAYWNQTLVIATLVMPHISQCIARTPVRNPNNNGGDMLPRTSVRNPGNNSGDYPSAHPQEHRALHSPSQRQHQFQNLWVVGRPNNVIMNSVIMNRPVQAFHSQRQQIWRPRSDR